MANKVKAQNIHRPIERHYNIIQHSQHVYIGLGHTVD